MSQSTRSVRHFSQSNPDGPGQRDVPALLRRVADTIEEFGDIVVQDIVFQDPLSLDDNDLAITVYFVLHEAND
jgi:hypothetical protein